MPKKKHGEPSTKQRMKDRIRRNQPEGVIRVTGKRGRHAKAWDVNIENVPSYLPTPHFGHLTEAPKDLVDRALDQKLPWIQRFVLEGCPHGKLEVYAREYAERHRLASIPPVTTMRTWAKLYKVYGHVGLVDKPRVDVGKSRSLADDDEWLLAVALFGGKANIAAATRLLAKHSRSGREFKYCSVRRAAQRLIRENPHLAAFAAKGELYLRNYHRLAMRLGFFPGGTHLAVDSTVANIHIRIPDPRQPGGWRAIRIILTVVMDIGTRMIVTFNLSLHPIDSDIMRGIFRRVVCQDANYPWLISTGVPQEITLDRGAEYRRDFRRAMERLGVTVHVAESPETNGGVERVIQTIETEVFSGLKGYSETHQPFNPYAPDEADAKRTLTQLAYEPYRLDLPVESLLRLPELEGELLGWATTYNQRPHPRLSFEDPLLQRLLASMDQADAQQETA